MKFQACFTYHLWNREVFFLYSESQWGQMLFWNFIYMKKHKWFTTLLLFRVRFVWKNRPNFK